MTAAPRTGSVVTTAKTSAAPAAAAPRVLGAVVDAQTRCAHYRGERDVIAMRFACCGDYYPCIECHEQAAGHPVARWRIADLDRAAVLCGVCRSELSIREYLTAGGAIGDATAGGTTGGTTGGNAEYAAGATNGAAPRNAMNDTTHNPAADPAAAHDPACPRCAARFNPGCRLHHDRYFDFPPPAPS